MDNRKN